MEVRTSCCQRETHCQWHHTTHSTGKVSLSVEFTNPYLSLSYYFIGCKGNMVLLEACTEFWYFDTNLLPVTPLQGKRNQLVPYITRMTYRQIIQSCHGIGKAGNLDVYLSRENTGNSPNNIKIPFLHRKFTCRENLEVLKIKGCVNAMNVLQWSPFFVIMLNLRLKKYREKLNE